VDECRQYSIELEAKLQHIDNAVSSFSETFEEHFGGDARAYALMGQQIMLNPSL